MQTLPSHAQRVQPDFVPRKTLVALAIAATLTACGGSGDDDNFATPLVVANPSATCASSACHRTT